MATATATPPKAAKPPRKVKPDLLLKNERGGTFRLMQGPHAGPGPAGCACDGCLIPTPHTVRANLVAAQALTDAQLQNAAVNLGIEVEGAKREELVKQVLAASKASGEITYVETGQQHLYHSWQPHRHGPRDEYTNDIVVSPDIDLAARFGSNKFQRLDEHSHAAGLAAPQPMDLGKMTLRQLLAVAEEEEIDLKGETKREKVIELLRAAKPA